jgi:hypothetical protein
MSFLSRLMPVMLFVAVACHAPVPPPASSAPTPAPAAPASPGDAATDSSAPYEGPAVTVTLNRDDGAAKATVKVTFPTGGWELKHDSSRVKDRFGVARFTFSGPAPDDMVAQVLEEKEWTWESPESFSRAEVWVRIVRRGQTSPSDYRLAAKTP